MPIGVDPIGVDAEDIARRVKVNVRGLYDERNARNKDAGLDLQKDCI